MLLTLDIDFLPALGSQNEVVSCDLKCCQLNDTSSNIVFSAPVTIASQWEVEKKHACIHYLLEFFFNQAPYEHKGRLIFIGLSKSFMHSFAWILMQS